jgi:arylsulfatase A-like enzyme
MITRMDADIGRLLAKLEQMGVAEKTLILFSSDNGPHAEGGNDPNFNDSNGPLKGIKRDLTDGGIRVPMIARWPGKIAEGKTSEFVGDFADLMPTLAELTGTTDEVPDDIDGVSLLPTLLGESGRQKERDYLYWAFYERGGGQAVRMGKWKAIQQPINTAVRLYDLSADIGEEQNVAAKHPDVVAQTTAAMKDAYRPSEEWKFPAGGGTGKKGR